MLLRRGGPHEDANCGLIWCRYFDYISSPVFHNLLKIFTVIQRTGVTGTAPSAVPESFTLIIFLGGLLVSVWI